MPHKFIQTFVSFSFILFTFTGCATIIKGYEDRVDLINAPDSIKVYTQAGIEIPVLSRTEREFSDESKTFYDKEIKSIKLRANKEHLLMLPVNDKRTMIELYPRIGSGWFILNCFAGLLPMFIDAYTGSWNHFPPIIINF